MEIWEKNEQINPNEKFTWNNLTYSYKDKIRDGLLRYDEDETGTDKWKSHNKCRNPGNRSVALGVIPKTQIKDGNIVRIPYIQIS